MVQNTHVSKTSIFADKTPPTGTWTNSATVNHQARHIKNDKFL